MHLATLFPNLRQCRPESRPCGALCQTGAPGWHIIPSKYEGWHGARSRPAGRNVGRSEVLYHMVQGATSGYISTQTETFTGTDGGARRPTAVERSVSGTHQHSRHAHDGRARDGRPSVHRQTIDRHIIDRHGGWHALTDHLGPLHPPTHRARPGGRQDASHHATCAVGWV